MRLEVLRVLPQDLHLTQTLWKGVLSTAITDSAGKTEVLQAGQRGAAGGAVQPILKEICERGERGERGEREVVLT